MQLNPLEKVEVTGRAEMLNERIVKKDDSVSLSLGSTKFLQGGKILRMVVIIFAGGGHPFGVLLLPYV